MDVISLSMAPSVSSGPASFLNLLEAQLLLATKAGVSVVQAVGNGGPDENTVVSFSPWILSVAASTTDRKYRKSIIIGNGKAFSCGTLSGIHFNLSWLLISSFLPICSHNSINSSFSLCYL